MIKKADTQLIKRLNETRILNLIREQSPISRIDIARQTQMSKVAVSEIINRLIVSGFVEDIGKGVSTERGGKRPSMLKLNANQHFVIGIELKQREALLAVANMEAEILNNRRFTFDVGTSAEVVLSKMFRLINSMLNSAKINHEQLMAIGIGLPGLVDYKNGCLRFADTLKGWDRFNLRERFKEKFNIPVILENDVNTVALGESILGAGSDYKDLVCIWVGEGVGAGLIVGNQLVQGFGGSAGEIGYLEINRHCVTDREFKYLYHGQKYFGDVLSDAFLHKILLEKIVQETAVKADMSLSQILKTVVYQSIIKDVLDEYAYFLGTLCLVMIKVVNPSLLVLSGTVVENSEYLFDRVRSFVNDNTREIPFGISSIAVGKLKDEAGLRGSIAMALQIVFATDTVSMSYT